VTHFTASTISEDGHLNTDHLVSSPPTRGMEMLPRLRWTPDWTEAYRAEGAPDPDIPAYETAKLEFQGF